MTLYRQLILIILALFIAGFLGTIAVSTGNLRHFLVEQLGSHAQDTATSLGLSLSAPMQGNDLPVMESMVDAIFDHGYYKTITLINPDGSILIERSNPTQIRDIPDWFVDNIDLRIPTAEALVMSGWKQAATVRVTSHPGYAYRELWENTVDTFWLFFLTAVAVMLLGLVAIHLLLQPLHRVETQAEAICNRHYPIQEKLPRTRELRRVVLAMNRLTTKVNEIFTEQSALAERLREQAFQDPLTGLGNRRYFDRQLQTFVESREEPVQGALALLELHHLERINNESGYQAGDQLLQRAGQLIESRISDYQDCYACRISGAGFGIIGAGLDGERADTLATKLSRDMLQLNAENLVSGTEIANIGVAMWKQGDTVPGVLAEVDIALRSAQSRGDNAWFRYEPPTGEQAPVQGAGHWHEFLDQVIQTRDVCLFTQPVFRFTENGQELLHREILLRVPDESGHFMTAGLFMPMAERTGLAITMDRLAASMLLDQLRSTPSDKSIYALNLSSTSLHDPVFMEWLCSQLQNHPDSAGRVVFEFTECGILRDSKAAENVIHRLAGLGYGCGIDHFGRGFNSFGYLRSINAHYLKIDGSYIRNIHADNDNQFFVQALTDTAHSVDIMVLAEAVETEAEQETIKALNVDGIQGYLAGNPEPV